MKNQRFSFPHIFLTFALGFLIINVCAQPCAVDVGWTSPDVNTVISNDGKGTTVTKASGGNGWVSGAYDLHPVTAGGFVEFRAGENTTYKMIGLNSDPTANYSYSSIDYAYYPHASNAVQVYENGAGRGQVSGAYSATDVFRVYWNPSNNRIQYLRNGNVEYTSTVVPSGTLYVDISLYTQGSNFTNVIVQGNACDYPHAAAVSWVNRDDGSTVYGTNNITKTGGTANSWSSGAYSLQPVNAGGFVQFQAEENNTYKMLGLNSDPATDYSYCSIDYCWYAHVSGTAYIYQNCSNYYTGPGYNTNTVFKIYWNPSNNKIEYYMDDVLRYTSTITPSGTYYVDLSLYSSGAGFTNVIVANSEEN